MSSYHCHSSVTELFLHVQSLVPGDQEIISVGPEESVAAALATMRKHRISQVPVTVGNAILGIFSYRSFAVRAVEMGGAHSIGSWPVDEFMEQIEFRHRFDNWQTILDELQQDDAVLVGNKKRLDGILTPMDVVAYLQQTASPYLVLAEVELTLRRIIEARITPEEMQAFIRTALPHLYGTSTSTPRLSELTFDNYVKIITCRNNWPRFTNVFGESEAARKRTNGKLEQIRKLRNDAFHFNRELTTSDHDTLVVFRDWLQSKARAYEERQGE